MKINYNTPPQIESIETFSRENSFNMNSEPIIGHILSHYSRNILNGNILEIGTGCGYGSSWILSSLKENTQFTSIDTFSDGINFCIKLFSEYKNAHFEEIDGNEFLINTSNEYDLIFADAWPGKFENLNISIEKLKSGGMLILDDLLPQDNWPPNHQSNVDTLIDTLQNDTRINTLFLKYGTGYAICRKI